VKNLASLELIFKLGSHAPSKMQNLLEPFHSIMH